FMPDVPVIEHSRVVDLPPLPAPSAGDAADEWASYERLSPRMVRPEILNRDEVRRFLERRYERIIRATGATGVAMLTFWIDEEGSPQRVELASSSGHEQLDEAALELSEVIRFTPAVHAGKPVRVKVDVPIRFQERIAR